MLISSNGHKTQQSYCSREDVVTLSTILYQCHLPHNCYHFWFSWDTRDMMWTVLAHGIVTHLILAKSCSSLYWMWVLSTILIPKNSYMSMSVSIIDLYSTESWSVSTALFVLSGNDKIGLFSAIILSCCWWAPGRRDCPVVSSRPSDQRQRRPDDRKCWAGNVIWSGDVEWLTVNDVDRECLRPVYDGQWVTKC